MSSEAITRNDLTNILNGVLPPTPSEYKKLLWTNPNPTTNFPTQALLNGQDLTMYDAIEVIGVNYSGYGSIMPPLQIPIGGKGNLIGLAGSTGDSAGMGFLVMRGISANTNSIVVSGAMGVSTNGTSWSANDNNMVPVRIYGIKYERVAPPQLDASDYVIEQGTETISGADWTYRKWNSGIAECWGGWSGSLAHYGTAFGGYAYFTSVYLPTGLFTAAPLTTYSAQVDSSFALTGTQIARTNEYVNCYAVSGASGTQPVIFMLHCIGRWK